MKNKDSRIDGKATAEGKAKRHRALADTLPAQHRDDRQPVHESGDLLTSAAIEPASETAAAPTGRAGPGDPSGTYLSEDRARELIGQRMAQHGIELAVDVSFSRPELLVTLDGYDANRKVGFQFVSHAGADVVSDFNHSTEDRLRELGVEGDANILIVHDYEASDSEALVERVDAFLASL